MQHTEALNRLRSLFQRQGTDDGTDVFSGPTLIEQEPDLVRETARYNLASSGWAASGYPVD